MAWNDKSEQLTEGQKKAAKIAGIPDTRPGLGGEYPKAVYKKDEDGADRLHLGKALLVGGKHAVQTAIVGNADEEAEALAQGWYTSPDLEAEEKKLTAIQEKDAEIAALKAKLERKEDEDANKQPGGNRIPGKLTA